MGEMGTFFSFLVSFLEHIENVSFKVYTKKYKNMLP